MLEDMAEERQLLVDQLGMTTLTMEDPPSIEDVQKVREFDELLERANTEDLTEIEKTGCLYQAGVDKAGRPVVVFIGKWFKVGEVDMDKAVLYLVKVLEPIVDMDYVVVYFCTKTTSANMLSYWWIKEVYNMLLYKYKKNLKAFYIVHPSLWTRLTTWWFTTFMAPAIKHKIHNIHAVADLDNVIHSTQFDIPMFIQEYDMTLHGLRYYQP